MSEYKMIVLDLDGTLTNQNKEITPKTKETLMKAQEQGKIVVRIGFRQTDLRRDAVGGRIASGGLRWIYPVLQWWNHYELQDQRSGLQPSDSGRVEW